MKTTSLLLSALLLAGTVSPVLAEEGAAVTEIEIKPDPTTGMKWTKEEYTLKAGTKVKVTLNNDSNIPLQHNLLILKPGTLMKVGALANAMLTDPTAMAKGYIPESDDILFKTSLLDNVNALTPGKESKETIEITVPDEPGDYPFTCTFPGHWMVMKGVIKVVK